MGAPGGNGTMSAPAGRQGHEPREAGARAPGAPRARHVRHARGRRHRPPGGLRVSRWRATQPAVLGTRPGRRRGRGVRTSHGPGRARPRRRPRRGGRTADRPARWAGDTSGPPGYPRPCPRRGPPRRDGEPGGRGARLAGAAAAVAPAAAARVDESGRRIVSDDEIDALLAEVDPAAHREVVGTAAERAASMVGAGAAPRPGRLLALPRLAGLPQPRSRGRDDRCDRDRGRRGLQRRRDERGQHRGRRLSGAQRLPGHAGPRPGSRGRAHGEDPGGPEGRRLAHGARRPVLPDGRLQDRPGLVHEGHRRRADRGAGLPGPRRLRVQPGRFGHRPDGVDEGPGARRQERRGLLRPGLPLSQPAAAPTWPASSESGRASSSWTRTATSPRP